MNARLTHPAEQRAMWREMAAYCARGAHLRRTVTIALLVGVLLTVVNQLQVILGGHANAATWARCVANFMIPFVVSNLGLLSGRSADQPKGTPPAVEPFAARDGSK